MNIATQPPQTHSKMAASRPNNSTGDDGNSSPKSRMSTLTQQLLHKPAVKNLVVIVVTFIPAFLALSIINVIFTHVFVLSSYLAGTTSTTVTTADGSSLISSGDGAIQKRVKTVYVPPTEQDLEQLLIELETSEPLPSSNNNLNHGESPIKRAQSAISSLQALLEQQKTGVDAALKEMEELTEAYDSFVTRFQEDIAQYHNGEQTDTVVLEYLPQYMKRKALLDLDRGAMEDLFENVLADLNVLLKDDVMLRNSNDALMKLLNSNDLGSNKNSCDSSFLDLAKGNPTPELETAIIAPKQKKTATSDKTQAKNDASISITKDTARESDLYERIDSIKELLSRRELSGDGDKDPIDEEGVEAIREEVSEMVLTLLKTRQDGHAATKEMTEDLIKETSLVTEESNPEDADTAMCASPVMVEKMVQRGLDSIRSQADLQSTLISTVFSVVADEKEDDEFKQIMGALDKEVSSIDIPRIDFSQKSSGDNEENKKMPPKSDKRKTLSYVVDGPLLHQGVAGSIDSFVELISGYNDYVDELFDYIMSRQGVSVGTAAADGISNLVRKIPLPELAKLRQSGILGGRIRTLVDS